MEATTAPPWWTETTATPIDGPQRGAGASGADEAE